MKRYPSIEEAVMRDTMPQGSHATEIHNSILGAQLWPLEEASQSHWPTHSWEHDDLEDFLRNHCPEHLELTDTPDTDWDHVAMVDILGYEDAHVHHLEALGLDPSS